MPNQPETSTFPPVYQLETTDPVLGGLGGLSNQPFVQLTARSRFLLDHVTALENLVTSLAPKNSPSLTGTPRAPTPAAGSISTEVATAAFVRNLAGGVTQIAINANFYLSADQAGAAVIIVTGTLTADTYLLFPAAVGRWTVLNATLGGFPILARLAPGGALVRISSSLRAQTVFSNGADMFGAHTDYHDAFLTGVPTTPTAPDGTNTIQVASTAFARRAADLAAAFASNGAINTAFANSANQVSDAFGNSGMTDRLGWIKWPCRNSPSGILVMQWGTFETGPGGAGPATFPVAFPTQCSSFVAQAVGVASTISTVINSGVLGAGGVYVVASNPQTFGPAGNTSISWKAMGY